MERSHDSSASKLLIKLTAADLIAFERPSFHGCTKYAHCQLGNVCLSRRDGVLDLFVNVQRLRADLAAAVATRCKASGCVANLPDAVPAPALRSVDLCPNASSCCPG